MYAAMVVDWPNGCPNIVNNTGFNGQNLIQIKQPKQLLSMHIIPKKYVTWDNMSDEIFKGMRTV